MFRNGGMTSSPAVHCYTCDAGWHPVAMQCTHLGGGGEGDGGGGLGLQQ